MLITAGKASYEPKECEILATPSRTIYWQGLAFKAGLPAGEDSMRGLATVRETEIPSAAAQIKGAYFVAVHCDDTGNTYAFVDPCGMFHAYHTARTVATSFLDLSRREGLARDDFDPESIVEFLQFGHLYDDRTFFPQIRKIKANVVLRCNSDGSIDSLTKPVPDLSEPPRRSFDSLMRDFVTAVENEAVSVDITGGADSRLLAAALAYYELPFEMATGGRPGIPDVRIGAKVAQALGRPFFATYHSAARTDWDELFELTEGMFDVLKISRMTQLSKDRKSRGVTLSVSGACGELFREIWWMQDFPFYARRKPRIDRLFALRIAPYPFDHALLARRYRSISENYRAKILRRIWDFSVPSNGKSYDRVYYYFELPSSGGCFVTGTVSLLKIGLPYVDDEVIRIGYNLPPLQRVFSRFHRHGVTRYSPQLAQLPTTEAGVSLSSGFLPMSRDFSRYLIDRSTRLAKKVGQQIFKKTFFQESSDDPKIAGALARAVANANSMEVLADCGILDGAFAPTAVPTRYLGRAFALARLIEYLETIEQVPRTGEAARNSLASELAASARETLPRKSAVVQHPAVI
jgi:hypothetical protein